MPEVQEVFRTATETVRPDPGALDRQNQAQRRRVARQRAGGYALLAVLVITGAVIGIASIRQREASPANRGAGGDGPAMRLPFTVERLAGIWYEDPGTGRWPEPIMARFSRDGTFSLGGVLQTHSWISGTYEVHGGTIRFGATGGACGASEEFTWVGGIVGEGRLETEHRGGSDASPGSVGSCGIPIGEPYNFTRISPTSPAAAGITPGFYSGHSGPLSGKLDASHLGGLWLMQGTGHLLWVAPNPLTSDTSGSYRLDDVGRLAEAPRDEGRLEIGRRTLTFTSGDAARGCSRGDVMVWRNVRVEEGGIRGSIAEDSCSRGIEGPVRLLYLDVDIP